MACENLVIPKPLTNQCPSTLYGIPYQAAGRTVAGQTFPIAGIVLHCYDGTIGELCNEMKCRTRSSVISGSWENSFHYGIGAAASSGGFLQFVEDMNISWTFGTYKNNTYATVPPPNVAINWPTLQSEYGINTTPDVYTIDIALAIGHIVSAAQPGGCYDCPTASGLSQTQHDMLVQMLAWLSQEYGIPIDSEHITFHDLIHCGEGMECPCTDIETLLAEVAAFCPPCEQESWVAPVAENNDQIDYIYGVTEPCCPGSPGCLNLIPWNACFIGDLAIDGTLDSYILGLAQDPVTMQWCLTRGCIATLPPLIGCGTVDDPLSINLCGWDNFVPQQSPDDIVDVIGIDPNGCLVRAPWCDMVVDCETPLTVIDTLTVDLTVSGVNGHILQADVNISDVAGNQIVVMPDGLYVDITCADVLGQTVPGTIANVMGVDGAGNCVTQDVSSIFVEQLCILPDSAELPTHLLGRNDTDCPVYFTAASVVAAGLIVDDTNTIDLTLTGNVLTGDVIIDPLADNILVANPAGLYVPPFILSITGSNCLTVNRVGNDFTIDVIISPPVGGITNVVQCLATGLYVQRGADALVNGPLVGNGSDINPIDIDFSLMDAQDLCDFGGVLPSGILANLVGVDAAGCLRIQDPAAVISNHFQVADTPCINLTFVGNALSADPILSGPISGTPNLITCEAGGLFVPRGAGLTFLDTPCISVTETNGVVTATPIIDPDATNNLECRATGLYATTNIIPIDTDCINLDYNQNSGQLQAFPTLAGPQGGVPNILGCLTGLGLYVPEGAGLQVVDTTCINLTLQGAVLAADLIVDPTGDNQLTCLPAGAYVPPLAGLQIENTPCMALSIDVDTLSAVPILAPAQGGIANALTCLPDGLFVGSIQIGDLVATLDTDCIDMTLTPGGVISADLIVDPNSCLVCEVDGLTLQVDPDPCNAIECRANGLFVHGDGDQQIAPLTGFGAHIINGVLPADFNAGLVDPAGACTTITNDSDCNDMIVTIAIDAMQLNLANINGTLALITARLEYSIDGGANWIFEAFHDISAVVPAGGFVEQNTGPLVRNYNMAPGGSMTFCIRQSIFNADGNFNGTAAVDGVGLSVFGIATPVQ